jgi:hypothetical protein
MTAKHSPWRPPRLPPQPGGYFTGQTPASVVQRVGLCSLCPTVLGCCDVQGGAPPRGRQRRPPGACLGPPGPRLGATTRLLRPRCSPARWPASPCRRASRWVGTHLRVGACVAGDGWARAQGGHRQNLHVLRCDGFVVPAWALGRLPRLYVCPQSPQSPQQYMYNTYTTYNIHIHFI